MTAAPPDLVFEAAPPVTAQIHGESARFPVRRVFCIGRNYAAHAREMGRDPNREPPFFFTKWAETVIPDGSKLPYPPQTANFQYEGELVLAMGVGGFEISVEDAPKHIFGYACGLDMTRRDLQFAARDAGRPWDTGKNVEGSSPLGAIHRAESVPEIEGGELILSVNGQVKQRSELSKMIWNTAEIIAHVSRFYHLAPGDLIYTGTPEGVGAVVSGDEITVEISGLSPLRTAVVQGEPT